MNLIIDPQLKQDLHKAHLRYTSTDQPGLIRKKYGKGFKHFSDEGKPITDQSVIERINGLVIPPAWKEVWICSEDNGHLQATGIDEKGRKQYLYHPDWKKLVQENKFQKMAFFGNHLPEIREKITNDILIKELVREKILATVVWLLEHTFIRIGNEEYAKENSSYGLTTLKNKHATLDGKQVVFEFKGKSGVKHTISVTHPQITKIIRQCIELPGYEIFKYIDEAGQKHYVDSADVNDYLKSITGDDITAKDFRTWGGTLLSAQHLYKLGPADSLEVTKKNLVQTVKKVSNRLGNTTAVCKSYYIHPTIIKTYEDKILIPHFDKVLTSGKTKSGLTKPEHAVITLLEEYS